MPTKVTKKKKTPKYKSKLEERIGEFLTLSNRQFVYESKRFPYITKHTYKPDFEIQKRDGSPMYIETKGYFRPDDKAKLLAVRDNNPGIDLRLLFQNNNKFHKLSDYRYADWAERNNFKYSIGNIPEDWLNE